MLQRRTDLATEAQALMAGKAERAGALAGVRSRTRVRGGYPVTEVVVTSAQGAEKIGKPQGTYTVVELAGYWKREGDYFTNAAQAVGEELGALLPKDCASALVLGLGNAAMTPDAIGPRTAEGIFVTRHLVAGMPAQFGALRSVASVAAGVLGTTGVEAGELARGLVERTGAQVVIAVDALVARGMERLAATVQLSDSGIVPGSGVGNHRFALSQETMGVPVLAVGVPTVVEAATLAADLLEESGAAVSEEKLAARSAHYFVTSRDIDAQVREMTRILACGINLALQPTLELADIEALMA